MRVCIIGWYGTETIGDRGILAGIFSFLHKTYNSGFSASLGSLCPYFSERTLLEDTPFYEKILGHSISVNLFDSRVTHELDAAIEKCDLLIVGGGPLMHINALFMIEYAFKYAKKKGKKTMLFGCGVGPLTKKRHQRSTVIIAENSDKIILRDDASEKNLKSLYHNFNKHFEASKVFSSLDPSVQILFDYLGKCEPALGKNEDFIALNMRFFPQLYGNEQSANSIDAKLFHILQIVAERFPGQKIRLIPMGYFHLSHDDRDFLNTLKIKLDNDNVEVQNVILTLEQTMEVFHNATFNIGMRFHSVVFQTILNGKNFILDYTEPQKGKISGFLNDIGGNEFYRNRYINLQSESEMGKFNSLFSEVDLNAQFQFNGEEVKQKLHIYVDCLKSLA